MIKMKSELNERGKLIDKLNKRLVRYRCRLTESEREALKVLIEDGMVEEVKEGVQKNAWIVIKLTKKGREMAEY